jgi:hypothetical protein
MPAIVYKFYKTLVRPFVSGRTTNASPHETPESVSSGRSEGRTPDKKELLSIMRSLHVIGSMCL